MPVLMCLKTLILVSGTGMFEMLVLGKEVPALMHLRVVRATLPPSMLFADRALLRRGYSISVPNA